jgi:hypothetical protein
MTGIDRLGRRDRCSRGLFAGFVTARLADHRAMIVVLGLIAAWGIIQSVSSQRS